jgi:1-acyl-sn-glycerol-3-phosphate acyltransferase
LYYFARILAALGRYIFFRKITVSDKKILEMKGPMILAVNHPNAFIDSTAMCALFKYPIYTIVRGDVFSNPKSANICGKLNMIPIHRLSEGRQHMHKNKETFERCAEVLKNDGIILIFSEGLCENEWELRPLKKGTARIAMNAWEDLGDKFKVLPVALNFSTYKDFGKDLYIDFGNFIEKDQITEPGNRARKLLQFNRILKSELTANINMSQEEVEARKVPASAGSRVLYALFALIGFILNIPFYGFFTRLARNKTDGTVFYHSVHYGLLILFYPLYTLLLVGIGYLCGIGSWSWLLLLVAPITGYCLVRFRD